MAEASSTQLKEKKVAVVGSGLIGRSWCMLFVGAGYKVSLYDVNPKQVTGALDEIRVQLEALQKEGLSRGTLTVQQQVERISSVASIKECVDGAFYIQECVPERLELKHKAWEEIDGHVTGNVILASSASALLPSQISEKLANKARFVVAHPHKAWEEIDGHVTGNVILASSASALLPSQTSEKLANKARFVVAHPVNPPFYCPLVELIRAPWSDEDVVPTTKALMEEIGQDPIVVKKEIYGFVANRIQYAIMAEGWRLIRDGVVSVKDLDTVMSSGLGVRYAFNGPFKTAYLNADGFLSYCDRYSELAYRIQKEEAEASPELMRGSTMERIQSELEETVCPLSELGTKRQQRDRRLIGLAKLKREMDARDKQ